MQFRQSVADFPLMVKLGEKVPSWGISRWGGRGGLRFVPPGDEGFSVRGDRQRFVYKGRRRSHRFTILGDGAFEYDCILLREPESNVVSLLMEGAENFDFYRQPDFVKEPFLKGSYAVYKKDTLLGEGTGKLCHIHRPEIIDARGRRCWGELSVTGNRLCITIPEQWLGEATYPVVVDPTVGTATVGSQYLVEYDPPDDPWTDYCVECLIAVDRFIIPETINGMCTAFAYTNEDNGEDAGGRAVLFSDANNKPKSKLSAEENFINFELSSGNPKGKGWRSGTFQSNGSIASGSTLWFGIASQFFWFPRFDYGQRTILGDWDPWDTVPATFSNYTWLDDKKLSMYFTYTSAQNYVRVLTQGVSLPDSRKLTGNYKRSAVDTAKVNSTLSRFEKYYRSCFDTLSNTVNVNRLPVFFRSVAEQTNAGMGIFEKLSFSRKCVDDVNANSKGNEVLNVIREIKDGMKAFDTQLFPVLFVRSAKDDVSVFDSSSHWGAFVRFLFVTGGSIAETVHGAEYHRRETDTVQAEGRANRGLLLFVRIITGVFIRDYLLGRFLKARQELVLKSCISSELNLESQID